MINTEKPVSAIKYNGEALPMEAAPADGIVIKARNASGHPTEIDFYGAEIHPNAFDAGGVGTINTPFWALNKINLKTPISAIGQRAFMGIPLLNDFFPQIKTQITYGKQAFFYCRHLTEVVIDAPIVWGAECNGLFNHCTALITVKLPKFISSTSNSNEDGQFAYCTALTNVELGSVGNTVQSVGSQLFSYCTQAGLNITVYTTSELADTIIANIRNKATNATIILKDSTTGETLITSTIEEDAA